MSFIGGVTWRTTEKAQNSDGPSAIVFAPSEAILQPRLLSESEVSRRENSVDLQTADALAVRAAFAIAR